MADEITITRWCDLCPAKTIHARMRWRIFLRVDSSGGVDPPVRLLDTCDQHAVPLETLLGDVRSHGRTEDRPRTRHAQIAREQEQEQMPDPKMITCPCGLVLRRDTLRAHARDVHKIKFKPLRRCPDCGLRPGSPQGMAAHRRSAHGIDSIVEVCDLVRARL